MNDSVLKNIFKYMDIVVLERLDKNSFQMIGNSPPWLQNLYSVKNGSLEFNHPGDKSAFLGNFLIDAEDFWNAETTGQLWSGPWLEKNPDGEEYALEATAISVDQIKVLLIGLYRHSYKEKHNIIQMGRELNLDYHRLDKLLDMLRKSEARFKDLFESSPEAIFVEDYYGNVLDVNPAACRLHGIERNKLIGMNVIDLVPPDQREQIQKSFPYDGKEKWRRKEAYSWTSDNRAVPVEIIGTRIEHAGQPALLLHVRDMTERQKMEDELKRHRDHLEEMVTQRTEKLYAVNQQLQNEITDRITAEKALKESKEKYSALFECSNDAIFIHDLNDNILEVNRKAVELFGYTKREFIQLKLPQLYGPDNNERTTFAGDSLMREGFVRFEIDLKKKSGRLVNADVSSSLINVGSKSFVQAIIRDITERKHLESQLRQSQKMEAVGRLAGGIAHDFNNLLTAINGNAEMALADLDPENPVSEYIKEILNAGDKAVKLTRQLLAVSRKQIVKPQVIDVNQIISNMDKMLHRLIEEDIHIETLLEPDIPKIKADPGQIEQILVNLVINARDALTHKVGEQVQKTIVIKTDKVHLDESYTADHVESKSGFFVILSVSDNGVGIDQDVQSKIFEPFFTTKGIKKGTGLGLSTVYGIVKQNNACIQVYSEVNHGTIFKIFWPPTEEGLSEEKQNIISKVKLIGNEKILLVEDDDAVRQYTRKSLQSFGYQVFDAENGGEALKIIRENKINFNMLITDVVMPEMNGKVLAQKLLQLLPTIKVLYVSGYTNSHIVHNGIVEDNIHFVQKPYSVISLISKVREILDDAAS